jgi:endonuclease/exonuclease/phosphatase family metal-dependent hydrolase
LARGDAEFRQQQAVGLREWARNESTPIIAIGDFNFDYDFNTKKGNSGFDAFLKDGVWKWIKPVEMIDTNWSDDNGKDRFPDSMLDFNFVAGAAKEWYAERRVIVREGDFPDDEKTSDHRPVELILWDNQ